MLSTSSPAEKVKVAQFAVYLLAWRARRSSGPQLDEELIEIKHMITRWLGGCLSFNQPSSFFFRWAHHSLKKHVFSTDLLQHRVPGVPVVLVCTHVDVVNSPNELAMQVEYVRRVVEQKLQEQAEDCDTTLSILDGGKSFCINSLSGDGVEDLRSRLISFATSKMLNRATLSIGKC